MATGNEDNKSSPSKFQQKPKVKFDLDDIEKFLDETDEFLEFSTHSNNPSSPSIDSDLSNTSLNNGNKSTTKHYSRYFNDIT